MGMVPGTIFLKQEAISTDETSPDVMLAKLFSQHFGAEVTPTMVIKLIKDHWSKLSPLAHAVHDAIDRSHHDA